MSIAERCFTLGGKPLTQAHCPPAKGGARMALRNASFSLRGKRPTKRHPILSIGRALLTGVHACHSRGKRQDVDDGRVSHKEERGAPDTAPTPGEQRLPLREARVFAIGQ